MTTEPVVEEPFGQQSAVVMILPLAAFLSLILMATCAIMWYRSYVLMDQVERVDGTVRAFVESSDGRLVVSRTDFSTSIDVGSRNWNLTTRPFRRYRSAPWPPSVWRLAGVEYRSQPLTPRLGAVGGWWFQVRWPTLVLATAVLPAWRLVKDARRKRLNRLQSEGSGPADV